MSSSEGTSTIRIISFTMKYNYVLEKPHTNNGLDNRLRLAHFFTKFRHNSIVSKMREMVEGGDKDETGMRGMIGEGRGMRGG